MSGLQARPELNGQRGTIIGPQVPDTGRYPVRIDTGTHQGEKLRLQPRNLEQVPLDAAVSAEGKQALATVGADGSDVAVCAVAEDTRPPELNDGMMVILRGLAQRAELNGERASVLGPVNPQSGRVPVRINTGANEGERLMLHPHNVDLLPPDLESGALDGRGHQMRMLNKGGIKEQRVTHGRTVQLGGSDPITKGDRLNQAAFRGDVAKVKKLLKAGDVDVNHRHPETGAVLLPRSCRAPAKLLLSSCRAPAALLPSSC